MLFRTVAFASTCTAAFPNAAQTNTNGDAFFSCGTQIINNPTTTLPFINVNNPSGSCTTKTCVSVNCTSTGNGNSMNAGSFQMTSGAGGNITVNNNTTTTIDGNNNTTTDYNNVTLGTNSVLNFSPSINGTTTYRINTLNLNGNNGTVNFQPGDYWINNLTLNSNTPNFVVVGSGTARIFVNNAVTTTQSLQWNTAGSASKLLYYGYGDLSIDNSGSNSSTINAIIYLNQRDLTLGNNTALTGAVNVHNVTLKNTADITYDSNAVNNMNYGFICPAPATSQFGVTAPSTGSNCQNMTITVTAQNSLGQTVTNYTGAITISTQNSTGTWVSTTGGGAFSGGSSGIATYQYVLGDNGVVTFQLNYPASGASPITIKAFQTNSIGILGLSNPINFIPASLLVTASSVPNPPASPPSAFTTTQTSGVVSSTQGSLILTAYTSSGCGIVTSYTGTKTLRMYTTYVNPTTGTINAVVNNGTSNFTIANSASATATNVPVTFVNGVSNPNITITYSDVGSLSLSVQDTAASGPGGASGNFITKPFAFAINVPGNSASQVTTPPATAQTACLGDSIFKKAGAPFTVNVQPQNATGGATPNYGNETPAQGILLQSSALVAPTGGRNGSTNTGTIANGTTFSKVIGGGSPFTGAYFTGSTFSFDEVGCINLTAGVSAGSYLGTSNVTVSTVVGRFTPDHFSVAGTTPRFNPGCGSGQFTYLAQPFSYAVTPVLTVTAQALTNTTTQNYAGSFWKLNSTFNPVYNAVYYSVDTAVSNPSLTLQLNNASTTPTDNLNGTTTVAFTTASPLTTLQVQKPVSGFISPVNAELQLSIPTITDTDAVACTGTGCVSGGFAFGTTASSGGIVFSPSSTTQGKLFYHGRMFIQDTAVSELLSDAIPVQTQYYATSSGNSLGFIINPLDSCTSLAAANIGLTVTPVTGVTPTVTMGTVNFVAGANTINLTAPGVTEYVDVQAKLSTGQANLPWLQYPWPYGGVGDPIGRASFGIFPGNNRIIYQQEVYQ